MLPLDEEVKGQRLARKREVSQLDLIGQRPSSDRTDLAIWRRRRFVSLSYRSQLMRKYR